MSGPITRRTRNPKVVEPKGLLKDEFGFTCAKTEGLTGARARAVAMLTERGHRPTLQGLTLECYRCDRQASISGVPGAYILSGPALEDDCV